MADIGNSHGHLGASKLTQLIAHVLEIHGPVGAKHAADAMAEAKHDFLEGLEAHTTNIAGPLIDLLLQNGDMPPAVRSLLMQAKDPSAEFGSFVQQFLIYGVMFSLASTSLEPLTQILANTLWSAFPDKPLTPPDIATAVVRGIGQGDSAGVDIPDWAGAEAQKSGVNADVFATMVGVTGEAPALQLLFEMIRRGVISEDQLTQGIKEGDIKDKWIPFVEKLRYVQPSPTDFVRAAIQAQMDYETASSWATKVGLEPPGYLDENPDWFRLLYNTAGRPPGPEEAARMANRGIIPWTGTGSDSISFAQVIAESDVKTKYTDALQKLGQYYPPNGEISNLLLHGGITVDQAKALWKANGVADELATAYAHIAEIQQVTQDRALAKGDIMTLVQEKAITDAQAIELLGQIGYTGNNAAFIVGMANFRYDLSAERNSIRRLSTLYTSHKITTVQLQAALGDLGLPAAQVKDLLETLTIQRETNLQQPTAAQVEAGFFYQIIDQPTAVTMLQNLGYDAWSAWFVLSARMHGAIPDEPPRPAGV